MTTVSPCLCAPATIEPEPLSGVRLRSVPPEAAAGISYEQAIELCGELVRSMARRFSRACRADYDDLVQEGWLAVFGIVDRWREDVGPLVSFAYVRVRGHLCKVVSRSRRRGMSATKGGAHLKDAVTLSIDVEIDGRSMHDELGEDAPQEQAMGDAQERAVLQRAIETLGARDREVVRLLNEGHTYDQIGRVLGMNAYKIVPKIHEHLSSVIEGRTAPKRHKSANAKLEHDGRSLSILEWARESGIAYGTLQQRLHQGLTLAEALSKPLRKSRKAA